MVWFDAVMDALMLENKDILKRFTLLVPNQKWSTISAIIHLVKTHPHTNGCYNTSGGLDVDGHLVDQKCDWHPTPQHIKRLDKICENQRTAEEFERVFLIDTSFRLKRARFLDPDGTIRYEEKDFVFVNAKVDGTSEMDGLWVDITPYPHSCEKCGKTNENCCLSLCSRCKKVRYCSRDCQQVWPACTAGDAIGRGGQSIRQQDRSVERFIDRGCQEHHVGNAAGGHGGNDAANHGGRKRCRSGRRGLGRLGSKRLWGVGHVRAQAVSAQRKSAPAPRN